MRILEFNPYFVDRRGEEAWRAPRQIKERRATGQCDWVAGPTAAVETTSESNSWCVRYRYDGLAFRVRPPERNEIQDGWSFRLVIDFETSGTENNNSASSIAGLSGKVLASLSPTQTFGLSGADPPAAHGAFEILVFGSYKFGNVNSPAFYCGNKRTYWKIHIDFMREAGFETLRTSARYLRSFTDEIPETLEEAAGNFDGKVGAKLGFLRWGGGWDDFLHMRWGTLVPGSSSEPSDAEKAQLFWERLNFTLEHPDTCIAASDTWYDQRWEYANTGRHLTVNAARAGEQEVVLQPGDLVIWNPANGRGLATLYRPTLSAQNQLVGWAYVQEKMNRGKWVVVGPPFGG